jgi:protein-tyrosine sulfotransferase
MSGRRWLRDLPVLVRGRPFHGPERYRPFFIVGSGRCGSTLLRAMLEAHPDIHIPPEIQVLGGVVQDYRRYSRLPWDVVLRIVLGRFACAPEWRSWELPLDSLFAELRTRPPAARHLAAILDGVYRAHTTQHKPAATRWGDKGPKNVFNLPALHALFPDLRVVHLVRDGRDVVESFMRAFKQTLPPIARHWLGAVRAAQAFGARYPAQYLEVRYEEVVRQAHASMVRVAAFLDVAFDQLMLRHHEFDLRLGDVEREAHLQGVREPVHQNAIGHWRTAFDAAQIAELDRLLGPMLAALGYESGAGNAGRGE